MAQVVLDDAFQGHVDDMTADEFIEMIGAEQILDSLPGASKSEKLGYIYPYARVRKLIVKRDLIPEFAKKHLHQCDDCGKWFDDSDDLDEDDLCQVCAKRRDVSSSVERYLYNRKRGHVKLMK